ncbi:hypothetical protein D9M69_500700 [compost metagenome]
MATDRHIRKGASCKAVAARLALLDAVSARVPVSKLQRAALGVVGAERRLREVLDPGRSHCALSNSSRWLAWANVVAFRGEVPDELSAIAAHHQQAARAAREVS